MHNGGIPNMRELIYHVGVSLDGYIAAPDGSADGFPAHPEEVADYFCSSRPITPS